MAKQNPITLYKRYMSTAKTYMEKGKKEWAYAKNDKGDFHYGVAQKAFQRAQTNFEKAQKLQEQYHLADQIDAKGLLGNMTFQNWAISAATEGAISSGLRECILSAVKLNQGEIDAGDAVVRVGYAAVTGAAAGAAATAAVTAATGAGIAAAAPAAIAGAAAAEGAAVSSEAAIVAASHLAEGIKDAVQLHDVGYLAQGAQEALEGTLDVALGVMEDGVDTVCDAIDSFNEFLQDHFW